MESSDRLPRMERKLKVLICMMGANIAINLATGIVFWQILHALPR